MIGKKDGDNGMRKPRLIWKKNKLIKMTITRDKMGMVSFLQKLETWETMLEIGFIFRQASNRESNDA